MRAARHAARPPRHLLLTLTVASLTLVLGLVVGAAVTSGRLVDAITGDRNALSAQVADLHGQVAGRDARLDAAERFVAANAPATVRGTLAGRTVAVVTAADADPGDVAAVTDLLARAGAQVTGRLQLTDAMLAPERAESVRALVPRLLPGGASLPAGADPGTLTGTLLAAVVTTRGRATPPSEAVTALTGLADAGLVRPVPPIAPAPAQLVLVLSGPSTDRARGATLARLAGALGRGGLGAVLAGRSEPAAVSVAQTDPALHDGLSTVADLARPSARETAVLALRDRAEGRPTPSPGAP